jgi:hypothetical protein
MLASLASLALLAACRDNRTLPAGPGLVAQGSLVLWVAPDSGTPADVRLYRFTLPVEIHGRVFQFVADHGAQSIISDSAIGALQLPHRFARATRADTLVRRAGIMPAQHPTASVVISRGDSTFEYWGDFDPPWFIDSLRIGASVQDKVMFVSEAVAASLHPFDGLVGRDILTQFDLEFNIPDRALRLYKRAGGGSAQMPRWLPAGMTAADCVSGRVVRHLGTDTTGMDSADVAETSTNPVKRMWDEEEIMLPLAMNGRPLDGNFDSGSGESIINWAAARSLGLTPHSPTVTPISSGSYALFSFHQVAHSAAIDTMNYRAAGVTLKLGNRELPRDSVVISDLTFVDYADFTTKPLILVGLRHFRDNVLFLSYSTGKVCVGDRRKF